MLRDVDTLPWSMAAYMFTTMSIDMTATITAEVGDCNKNSAEANITQTEIPMMLYMKRSRPMNDDQNVKMSPYTYAVSLSGEASTIALVSLITSMRSLSLLVPLMKKST